MTVNSGIPTRGADVVGPGRRRAPKEGSQRTASSAAKNKNRAMTSMWNTIGVLIFVELGFPVYWMRNTSLKKPLEWQNFNPHFSPDEPTYQNFTGAFHTTSFVYDLKNSVIITFGAVLVSLVIGF